jgi:hypothetical protein
MNLDIKNIRPGMRVKNIDPTWEDYKKHGIVISVNENDNSIEWFVIGGKIKKDKLSNIQVLGLKNKKPIK